MINRKTKTRDRMRNRLDELSNNFQHYLDIFSNNNHFSGPSTYFHEKTLRLLKSVGSVNRFVEDETCVDSLYATLVSWGLHRMGVSGSKLVERDAFQTSLKRMAPEVEDLSNVKLVDLSVDRASVIGERLSIIVENAGISKTNTQLVSCSKALHHLLPSLVPPIDRNYTLRFFYSEFKARGERQPPVSFQRGTDAQIFRDVFSQLHSIGFMNRDLIRRNVGRQFFTSESKVIDNAIMGYIIEKIGAVDEDYQGKESE